MLKGLKQGIAVRLAGPAAKAAAILRAARRAPAAWRAAAVERANAALGTATPALTAWQAVLADRGRVIFAEAKRATAVWRSALAERGDAIREGLRRSFAVWQAAIGRERERPRVDRKAHELEFLPAAVEVLETPASPAGRAVAMLICALFLATIAWGWFGKIDTEAVAQGKIIPGGKAKVIQPLEIGVVRAIHVGDGQSVEQGDLLIELDPTESGADRERLQRDLLAARLDVVRFRAMIAEDGKPEAEFASFMDADRELAKTSLALLRNRLAEHEAQLAALDGEIEQRQADRAIVDASIKKLEETIPLLAERAQALEILAKKKVGTRSAYLKHQQELVERQGDLQIEYGRKEETTAAISTLQRRRAEMAAAFRAKAFEEVGQALQRVAAIEQELRKAEERFRQRRLTAPVDGIVHNLAVNTVGAVVAPTEPLMAIVPSGSELEVEALVLNKDIGFVAAGQTAEIKVESFPFTRYGLVNGKVQQISADAVQDEQMGAVFKARVAMQQDRILVDDRWVKLAPGMAVTVEVKTGQRRALEFFFAPFLRYQDEALKER